jgi:carbon storage regulator
VSSRINGTRRARYDQCLKSAWAVAEGVDNGLAPPKREYSMLVLSRKLGEKIIIGDNIVVTVVKIDRNQIRLGIEAPHEVPVYREEISPTRANRPAQDEAALVR